MFTDENKWVYRCCDAAEPKNKMFVLGFTPYQQFFSYLRTTIQKSIFP